MSHPTPALVPSTVQTAANRRALGGFFLSGLLFSFVGTVLPAWGFHLRSDYLTVSLYFLFLNFGVYAGFHLTQLLVAKRGVRFALLLGSGLATACLFFLAWERGMVADSFRLAALFGIGFSGALVNTAIFHAITPLYEHDPVGTLNLCGVFFTVGSLAAAVLVAATFDSYSVPEVFSILAAVPFMYFVSWAGLGKESGARVENSSLRMAWRDFRSPAAVFFTLLLFFQFGNEWAIAGWLPLFLIQRLGVSPSTALYLLALYWASLLIGRIVAQILLKRIKHSRLLLASTLSALTGCTLLLFTTTEGGAWIGILLVGAGFAAVYPLTVESIEHRFPYYHPGFYNGIFSLGLTGALLAPSLVGLIAEGAGVSSMMLLPLAGSLAVFVLVLLIWLQAQLTKAA